MSFLPQNTDLGELETIEIYSYYNGPRLFSCRNSGGTIYFALWVDEEVDFDLWLYVPVSQQRFAEIRSGKVDLKNAFIKSEYEIIFEVNIFFESSSDVANSVPCEEIDRDWLPPSDDYLKLSSKDFSGANLSGFNLNNADLSAVNLSKTNLSSANLSNTNLSSGNLNYAILKDANLSGADLSGADLSYADLSYADLSDANLNGADLTFARLSAARLRNANLSGADLSGADLVFTNLNFATLDNADLSYANLSGVSLKRVKVNKAKFGENVDLSEDIQLDLKKRGAIFENSPGDRSEMMTLQ